MASGRGSTIGFDTPYEEVTKELVTFRRWHAEPVDTKDKTSAWITAGPRALKALRKMGGTSEYTGRKGVYAALNGVFWVEIAGRRPGGLAIISNVPEEGKKDVMSVQAAVEADLLYPLLRGRDVRRWSAEPSLQILLVQDPAARKGIPVARMKSEFPKAYSYLLKFEKALRSAGLFKRYCGPEDPFYTMFNVGPYTLAPWKVVFREIAPELTCAVIGPIKGRPVVPDHKLILIACKSSEEAHYLSGLLNSGPCRFFASSYAIETQFSGHILDNICVPTFKKHDRTHIRLAALSAKAHRLVESGERGELKRIEAEIDQVAAELWDLSNQEIEEILPR